MANMRNMIEFDKALSYHIGASFNVDYTKDLFGVEIELEGQKLSTTDPNITSYWKTVKDGSLRHKVGDPLAEAFEYVFRQPLSLEESRVALTNLTKYLNTPPTRVFESYRTSIHVHINCMNETIRTIANFITLAMIFDELFVSQNGQTRIGNNFCLRTRDAEGQVNDITESIRKFGTIYNVSGVNRYSSVNTASLSKFGTIEFRSMECTTDFDRIWHWLTTLQALKVAARMYENPKEVISKFSQKGALGFLIHNLGPNCGKYVAVPGFDRMLQDGMRLAQDLAYCCDWIAAAPRKVASYDEQIAAIKKKVKYAEMNMAMPAPPLPPDELGVAQQVLPPYPQWELDPLPMHVLADYDVEEVPDDDF